jgi:heme/copper-type cytochrome/quinol oxidase subunit 3
MMDKYRLGMLLFVVSEAMFFLLLIVAYVFYHRQGGTGPTAADSLDIVKTSVFSVFLLSSSLTMVLAERGHRRGQAGRFLFWLGTTIVFGAVFLIGQGSEYLGLIEKDVTISRNLFGTTFFTLTGFHGVHVFLGLAMLSVLLGLGIASKGREPKMGALDTISIYWHFVDGVWVFIFGVVYLWAFV